MFWGRNKKKSELDEQEPAAALEPAREAPKPEPPKEPQPEVSKAPEPEAPQEPEPTPAPAVSAPPVIEGTIIGDEMRIEGDVSTGSAVRVEGEVLGSVTSASDVEVAEGGLVRGSVAAHDVRIWGVVEGPVNTTGRLLIEPTGRVHGDVKVKSILIEEGGQLCGRCTMG